MAKNVPKYDEMINPLVTALKQLGGSGSIQEIEEKVFSIMGLSQEILDIPKNVGKPSPSKVSYRLAWTRNYLKNYGLLENSGYGIWALTPAGWKAESLDEKKVVSDVKRKQRENLIEIEDEPITELDELDWRERVSQIISKMDPVAFERLAQRLLRESGFVQVEVTGRSGDGGIDGKGILRIGGLMSFHVMFQCKRHQKPVSAGIVRDFRGALEGRADRGLLITSSTYTRDAKAEANRDGATPIELIDGDALILLMKEKGLGLKVEKVETETIHVLDDWFKSV